MTIELTTVSDWIHWILIALLCIGFFAVCYTNARTSPSPNDRQKQRVKQKRRKEEGVRSENAADITFRIRVEHDHQHKEIENMTREEQIQNAATVYDAALKKEIYPVTAFIEGAWWADLHQPTPWIDVNNALPPYDEDVIVATRLKEEEEFDFRFGHRAPAKIVKKDKNSFAIFMDGERVAYWMRLPKLPDTNTVNS